MSEYVPTPAFVEREYVTGRLRRSDVTAPEARAEFARMIASVERAAAERALTDLAQKIEVTSKRTDNTFTEHAVVEAGGLELLREAAEAYRQERGEQ